MKAQHEEIFRKAMVSNKPQAILEVGRAFHALGDFRKAKILHERAVTMTWTFGAMSRGTPIDGTNGAVIPPGRYWIDLVNQEKRKAWVNWTIDKPEVTVEKSEWMASDPEHVIETVIFSIPSTANNYGLPGVFFPTKVLGFPTIAEPEVIKSKADTVQRPPPLTHLDAVSEVPGVLSEGLQSGVKYTAETVGKAAGSLASGIGQGFGLSPSQLLIALSILALLVLH